MRDLVAGLLRQWYIVLVGLILTAGGAYWVYHTAPVSYQAQASLVLLPPESVTDGGNPYLALGGLGQALDILGQRIGSDDERRQLEKEFPGVTYTAGADTSTSGPILVLATEGGRSADALALLNRLQDLAPDDLSKMQQELNVPADAEIGITGVTSDSSAQVSTKTRTQFTLITVAVGVVLTVLVTAIIDRIRSRRRARREAAASART